MAKGRKNPGRGSGSHSKSERRITVEAEDAVTPEAGAEETLRSDPGKPTEEKIGGKKMAEKTVFESLADMGGTFLGGGETARNLAAFYVDTFERLTGQTLDLQARAIEWAKDTPFAPLLEAQNSAGREFVKLSASTARKLWRLEERPAS